MQRTPKPAMLSVRLPRDVRAELEAIAEKEERPLSFYALKAIRAYLEKMRQERETR